MAEKREQMQSLTLPSPVQQVLAHATLTYRFGEEHQPITKEQILQPRRWENKKGGIPTLTGKFN